MTIKIENEPMMKRYFIAHLPKVSPWIIRSNYMPRFNTIKEEWELFKFNPIDDFTSDEIEIFVKEVSKMKDFDFHIEILDSFGCQTGELIYFKKCNVEQTSFDNYFSDIMDINISLKFESCILEN